MQTYDPARRSPYQNAIPAMRHAPEYTSPSATPLYDALCAEYRMMFRTLPGDRSGEEDVQFKSFAMLSGLTGCTCFVTGLHDTHPFHTTGRHPTGGRCQDGGLCQTGGPHQGGALHQGGTQFPGPRHEPRQLPPGRTPPGPTASFGYGTPAHPVAPTGYGPHPAPGPAHVAHPTAPHQADLYGGYPPGIWHPVRKQYGYEALLPAVRPVRPPGNSADRWDADR